MRHRPEPRHAWTGREHGADRPAPKPIRRPARTESSISLTSAADFGNAEARADFSWRLGSRKNLSIDRRRLRGGSTPTESSGMGECLLNQPVSSLRLAEQRAYAGGD